MTERLNPTVIPADTPRAKSPSPHLTLNRDFLKKVWKSPGQSKKRGTAGIDGKTSQHFERDLDKNISWIVQRLKSGNYQFSKLRPFFIPKKGGYRVICVPTVEDRLVQRAMAEHLGRRDRFGVNNEVSYGFVEKRNVSSAIQKAIALRREREWAVKTDIQSFFDSIDRSLLKELVNKRLKKHSFVPLLCKVIDCEVKYRSEHENQRLLQKGLKPGAGLRQGMPLSPLLSNLVLADFDKAAMKSRFEIVRYADDLILLCRDKAEAEDGLDFIQTHLKKIKLTVPGLGAGSKTEIVQSKKPVEFLGLDIVYKETLGEYVCQIPRSVRTQVLDDIASNKLEVLLAEDKTFASFVRRMAGLPSSYKSAYGAASNWASFEPQIFEACHLAIEGVCREIFGDVVDKLDSRIKSFLGIDVKLQS